MFEGKHIHFSPTDHKPLCSYSGKLCRQRRLNGFAFCIRHILEDKSAPFKQCSFVTRNNSQKCLNAIPSNQDRGYCHSHMQVVGIIPKTERKSRAPSSTSTTKTDSNSSFSSNGSEKSPTIKKDPGAVFRFEEDSSDITDVFSYKNGLTNSATLNWKGHKGKESINSNNNNNSPKNIKLQNGFNCTSPGNFTTKKITDKNRNVYTAIIPKGNAAGNNNNKSPSNKNNIRNGSSNNNSSVSTQPKSSSSYELLIESNNLGTQKPGAFIHNGTESELNVLHDMDDLRQFENLKTLKQLDKSGSRGGSSCSYLSSDEENSCDAKFKIFPRLAALSKDLLFTNITSENESSSPSVRNQDYFTSSLASDVKSIQLSCKSEMQSSSTATTLPAPIITRTSNGIIIKTEPKKEEIASAVKGDKAESESNNKTFSENVSEDVADAKESISQGDSQTHSKDSMKGVLIFSSNNSVGSADDNNRNQSSIENKNLIGNRRHEFLARVRNSFKSQYTSIKKACNISERYEQDRKHKFRDSLVRCVKIDSGICAQVLGGNGSKLSSFSNVLLDSSKDMIRNKCVASNVECDDYEFYDIEGRLSVTSAYKACTAVVDQTTNNHSKSRKYYSNGKKSNNGDFKVKTEDNLNNKIEKGKATASRKNSSTGKKGKLVGPNSDTCLHPSVNTEDKANSKTTKRADKKIVQASIDDPKPVLRNNPSKRRLKRSDAVVSTGSDDTPSLADFKKETSSSATGLPLCNQLMSNTNDIGKRRRFSSNELTGGLPVSELGLTLTGHASPSGLSSTFELDHTSNSSSLNDTGVVVVKREKGITRSHLQTANLLHHPTLNNPNPVSNAGLNEVHKDLHDILGHSTGRNHGLETVLNSVGSSETAGTPDGVITDASFDSTFEHSTSSQPDCEFSEDDLEHSFELQIDPEIENQASRLLEDNVLTEADFTELFPDNRMSDHKFGRNELQELGMAALDFDVNDIDYSLFANIFPNFPRNSQPETISISNPF